MLARPIVSAILITTIIVGIQILVSRWPVSSSYSDLQVTFFFVVGLFPLLLSILIHFLAPVFAGWKEMDGFVAHMGESYVTKRIRKIAISDLLITMTINLSLVMPVRYSSDFDPSFGYGSLEFVISALILNLIISSLCLLSSWRSRIDACSGELYRSPTHIDLPKQDPFFLVAGKGWLRWVRYMLLISVITMVVCFLVGTIYKTAPIQFVLVLLQIPVAIMFWFERNDLLNSNFRDAMQSLADFPVPVAKAEPI